MAEIFSAIAVAVSALTLIVAIVIYNKIKLFPARGGTSDDTYRLEQKLDKIGYLTENNAQNMQGFAEYSAKNQSAQLAGMQAKMDELNRLTEQRLNDISRMLAGEIKYMSEQNAKNLEQIRQTVDEKLSSTLENRLNKSYSLINERLEAVYKGIGEVQQLAGSVSDIKKVFTNVKLRGTWGEVQLSALLEQMLSPNQYRANVRINPLDNAVVEFAVLLPSREDETVYLPVDSKFPVEEYQRLIDAGDAMNKEAADKAFLLMLGLPVMVLHDKFGFGPVRCERFTDAVLELYDSFEKGYVSLEDIHLTLKEETGITIVSDGRLKDRGN